MVEEEFTIIPFLIVVVLPISSWACLQIYNYRIEKKPILLPFLCGLVKWSTIFLLALLAGTFLPLPLIFICSFPLLFWEAEKERFVPRRVVPHPPREEPSFIALVSGYILALFIVLVLCGPIIHFVVPLLCFSLIGGAFIPSPCACGGCTKERSFDCLRLEEERIRFRRMCGEYV